MINYAAILEKVDKAITNAGSPILLLKIDRSPTDPNKPWNGTANLPIVQYTPHNKSEVPGVKIQKYVPQGEVSRLLRTSTLKEHSTYFLVSGKKVPGKFDFDKIKSADTLWTVVGVETIQPAQLRLLHLVEVQA